MKSTLITVFALGSLLFTRTARAYGFDVTLNTSALQGHPSGPFSLDFQLVDGSGSGDGNNSVVIGEFDFGGGGWLGGDPGTITLTDSNFLTEFFQWFTPGAYLKFEVSTTTALDAGPTPDEFSFALLDAGLAEIPSLGPGDSLLSMDFTGPVPIVAAYGTDPSRTDIGITAPEVAFRSVIPEASGVWAGAGILTLGLGSVWLRRLRCRKR